MSPRSCFALILMVCSVRCVAQQNVTTGGGTSGTIPVFTTSSDVENSVLSQSGTTLNVNGFVNAATSNGGSFFGAHQLGAGYGNPTAMFTAITDNPNGAGNFYFQGTAAGTQNYWVRADGAAYFGNVVQINAPALGTTVGSAVPLLILQNSNANQNYLNFSQMRQSDGNPDDLTTWFTATTRISEVTDYSQQGYIDFNPANGRNGLAFGSGLTEWMRLINGNVGIGTTNPSAKLEVAGPATITSDNSGVPQLLMRGATNNAQQLLIGYNTSSDYAYIQATKTGIANEPLALNPSNGNVGIGTTTPSATLEVNGNTQIDGNLVAGSITATSIAFPGGGTFTPALAASLTSSNGNVGIGTTSPQSTLDVNGNINYTTLTAGLGAYYSNAPSGYYFVGSLPNAGAGVTQHLEVGEPPIPSCRRGIP